MSDEEFNFEDVFGNDPDIEISLEFLAKGIVAVFKAFRREGLSTQEAATLSAAYFAQMVPQQQEEPRDGS